MDAHDFLCLGMRDILAVFLPVLIPGFRGLQDDQHVSCQRRGVANLVRGSSGDDLMGELGLVGRVGDLT